MITIVDYGLGNIRAFSNVYERLNIKTVIARKADDLRSATKIILPGVGSFDHAMNLLNNSGMRDELDALVLVKRVPVIGICLGMQIMAKSSDEGKLAGLNWFDAEVKLFDSNSIIFKTRYPHMGWNTIEATKFSPILMNLPNDSKFYFLHSYYFDCKDPADVLTRTTYGITYPSAINKGNIFGIQFHPEKSHSNGVQLLKNYALL
ncbi:MAG: imidazole glycerol phosphate synthase subunit HisH [Bacteroidetes bacterium HGW-Bacteroidetes-8]|jgi:glutamine amidotransferase|nr:MAG: imidazole glycerol phosphate synthase subunit HisH [Bacteroidetes bacterium HGW-Bacteroidetes-8]